MIYLVIFFDIIVIYSYILLLVIYISYIVHVDNNNISFRVEKGKTFSIQILSHPGKCGIPVIRIAFILG